VTSHIANLVRYPNLIMVAITMFIFWWKEKELAIDQDLGSFLIVILAVLATTAAGYIISDLHDVTTDKINKPGKAVIGNRITSKLAKNLYWGFLVFALICSLYLYFESGRLVLPIIVLLTNGLLFLYARFLKQHKLIGNLLVALLSAMVVLLAPLSGIGLPGVAQGESEKWFWHLCLGFALWAFVVSLAREIVKDLQDQAGDLAAGYRTLALHNESAARIVVAVLLVAQSILIVISVFCCSEKILASGYGYAAMLCLVALLLALRIGQARDKIAYRLVSAWLKVYLAAGIFFVFFWKIVS